MQQARETARQPRRRSAIHSRGRRRSSPPTRAVKEGAPWGNHGPHASTRSRATLAGLPAFEAPASGSSPGIPVPFAARTAISRFARASALPGSSRPALRKLPIASRRRRSWSKPGVRRDALEDEDAVQVEQLRAALRVGLLVGLLGDRDDRLAAARLQHRLVRPLDLRRRGHPLRGPHHLPVGEVVADAEQPLGRPPGRNPTEPQGSSGAPAHLRSGCRPQRWRPAPEHVDREEHSAAARTTQTAATTPRITPAPPAARAHAR